MYSELDDNGIPQEGQPTQAEVLADVYNLRRRIALGVYAIITLDLPLYLLAGYTVMQVVMVAIVGWLVAGISILIAFQQIIKLRRRTSYPELLLMRLGDTSTPRDAAAEALFILEGLLETNAAFIALEGMGGHLEVQASRGINEDEAIWVLETHGAQKDAALSHRYPEDVLGEGGHGAAFVPIVALKRAIGVLYVTTMDTAALRDRSLLNDIGGALGLSLDNMRQKEQLLQKESRIRSVVTGAPIVLFSVNNAGVVVFHQGQAMESVGISPDTLLGRPITDIYANYPGILQSFRRAFAGDEVLSTATIEAGGNRVIFEYRLAPEKDEHGRVTGVIGVATDITQRTVVADALREGERFLTTLVTNLPGFVIRLEGEPLAIKYVSDGVREITGFSARDLTDQPVEVLAQHIHPDDRALMRQAVRQARETGDTIEYEFRFTNRAGEERWFWQQGQIVTDEDGQPIALEMFTMDITERKRATDALQENERFLSTLVGNLPGFVMRYNTMDPRTITYVSDGVQEVLGLTAKQLIGQPISIFRQLMDQDDLSNLVSKIMEAARKSGTYEAEFHGIDARGIERWYWQQGEIVKDAAGNPVAIESFTMDITERKRANDALRESERFLSTLVGNLPGFVMRASISEDSRILYVTEAIRDAIGVSPDEVMGQPVGVLGDRMPEEERWRVSSVMMEAARGDGSFEVEFPIRHTDGSIRWLWEQGQVIVENGQPVGLEAFIMDVTARKQAERALEASEQRFRDIYENANDAMVTFSFRGNFIDANRRMQELLGYTEEELLRLTPADVTPAEHQERNSEFLKRVYRGDSAPFEVELIAKDGRRVPMEMTARIAVDEKGRARTVQMIGRDISERKQAEETIRRLAYHDSLTGLPNRALFEDRLQMAIAQAKRHGEELGVLFLDVDGFKLVNDTLGHTAGDKLLQSIASDISALVRDCDTVARVGGDEFTVLIPNIDQPEDVTDVAGRILECLRQPRTIAGQEFRATASIGITTFPHDGDDGETLLRNADTAMYRAKDNGRNSFQLYTASMNQRVTERLSFEQNLRQALSRDEMRVVYQPIVDVSSGRVVAAEALVRWIHPTRGVIPPDDFIPLAEETGIILDIGEFVLHEACRQAVEWQEQGLELNRVAVNLSARQLQQEDLVSRISDIIEETGVEPKRIQLEITEGAVLRNVDYAISMLRELRDKGLGIALDDFGTGYSSLTYLKRFPVDAVKIDRTFVRDLDHDAHDATIVSTVIGMAQNLGLRVIAEGVETPQQLEFLRARRCAEYQGYLFSKPVPPDEFPALVLPTIPQGNGAKKKSSRVLPPAG
jgi:diguanylate cyclase (GGDEF)-like protein/PAS domain S-box-containing protein